MQSCSLILLLALLAASQAMPAAEMHKSPQVSGTYGVDLSSYFSASDFDCLKGQGFDFAIVRAYQSYGKPMNKIMFTGQVVCITFTSAS